MIVIYTQDRTYLMKNADSAMGILTSVYGEKLGEEAYKAVNRAPVGTSYRKNGGPLVQVVTREKAEWIRKKETATKMI